MRAPALLPALLPALSLVLACGGGTSDPCAILVDQARPASASAADLGIVSPTLECSGTSGGSTLQCAGGATVSTAKCTDGFAFTIDGGSTRVLVRLRGGSDWAWGAQIAGGDALEGSLTIAGLRDPADPVPLSGMSHAASFALRSSTAVVNGQIAARW